MTTWQMVTVVRSKQTLELTPQVVDIPHLHTPLAYVAQVLQFQKLVAFVQEDLSTHASTKLVMAYRTMAVAEEAELLEQDVVDTAVQKYAVAR